MFRPRRSLLAALLALSVPPAFAVTLTVNTTTDDNAANSLCSLREAIAYFNKDEPAEGWQGCKPAAGDSSNISTVSLPASSSAYQVSNSSILIERSLTISGEGMNGDKVSTIQATGTPHRLFHVSFHPAYHDPAPAPFNGSLAPAPVHDAASDTADVGVNRTTNLTPPIIGSLAAPAATTTRVNLYAVANDGHLVNVGIADIAPGNSDWAISPGLGIGLYKLVYTTRDFSDPDNPGPESAASNRLDLAVHAVSTDTITVTVQGVVLQGCSPSLSQNCADNVDVAPNTTTSANGLVYDNPVAGTADNGGLIYTDSPLQLSKVRLMDGFAAARGGAIYGDANAVITLGTTDIRNNSAATDGAALFIRPNSLFASSSLLTANPAPAGAVLSIALDTAAPGSTATSKLSNLTVSGNTGLALSLSDAVVVNNATIVDNSAGIDFNSKAGKVYNSIVAGNPLSGAAQDCTNAAMATLAFSLVQTADGCQSAGTQTSLQTIAGGSGADKLMVDTGSSCDSQATGLLCRLAYNDGETPLTQTHKPRILPGVAGYAVVPFFNKGNPATGAADSCENTDARGKGRPANACDIGAVEMQETTALVLLGGVINYGGSWTESLASPDLGDEELQPVANCPPAAPAVLPATQYSPTARGCPWLEQLPGKGTVVFNADGSYTYRPSSDFHGTDRFTVRVMTTYSALQASNANKSRLIQVTIISEPATGISADSLGGGVGAGLWGGLLLLGMALRSRRRA